MKRFKKIIALAVAMIMVLGMSMSALAATITINKGTGATGTDNTEYTAYQIFSYTKSASSTFDGTTDSDLGAGTETGLTYTIAASSPWLSVVQDSGYFTLTPKGTTEYYVALADTRNNTADGAKAIADYFAANIPSGATATAGSPFKAGESQPVEDGYYLITSTLGKLVIAATSNITITEKNTYPTLKKTAEEANYGVGDHAVYYIRVDIPANVDDTEPIVVHDELPAVLKFDNNVKFSDSSTPLDEEADPKELTYGDLTNAFTVTTANLTDDCAFEITINASDTAAHAFAGHTIVFKYTAELLSTAAADTGYVNKAFLDYSDYKTPESNPEIKTFDFNLKKIFTGTTDAKEATFTLSDATAAIEFIKDNTGYVKKDSDDTGASTSIVVKNNETVNIRGLKAGEYTLAETATDAAYNLISGPITVTIAADGTATFSTLDLVTSDGDTVTITNNNGTVLPSTGGIGTTIFYILGSILVIGAGVLLVTKRRMDS